MRAIIELLPVLGESISIGPVLLPFTPLDLVVRLLLPIAGTWVALRIISRLLTRVVEARVSDPAVHERVRRWVRRVRRGVWAVVLIAVALNLAGAELSHWTVTVIRILNQPFFTSGSTEISVVTLLLVIPVFYLAGWASRLVRRTLEVGFLPRLRLDSARAFSILNVTRFVVMGVTLIVGLSVIGINLSSLAVLFGVLGIGVGFGLQDAVGNMFAGLIIVFTRPIKEGDRVLVDQIEGNIQQIQLLHTVVTTVTNETIIIPNSKITGNSVHNYSYDTPSIIVCNTVQVSYNSDLDHVREVMIAVGRRNPWRARDREVDFYVRSFDDSGISVRVCLWITDARNRIASHSWTNLEIWRAFRDERIEIPFPQVDVHVKRVADGVEGVEERVTS